MIWKVNYTDEAKQDLRNIFEYIRDTLLELETAKGQLRRIRDAGNSLDHFPLRCRLYDHEPWYTMGIRVLAVDNYLVLYLPDELQNLVTISRVIYGARNIPTQLVELEKELK